MSAACTKPFTWKLTAAVWFVPQRSSFGWCLQRSEDDMCEGDLLGTFKSSTELHFVLRSEFTL